jgi:hypothetical protein
MGETIVQDNNNNNNVINMGTDLTIRISALKQF